MGTAGNPVRRIGCRAANGKSVLGALAPEGKKRMFEQAAIAVQDEQGYTQLHALIDAVFDPRDVEVFLNRVTKSKFRIRDNESILSRGFLGKQAAGLYAALPVSDQGLTRERYLRLVEAVPVELRQRYFRAYAYY